jgi:hypothetical protein
MARSLAVHFLLPFLLASALSSAPGEAAAAWLRNLLPFGGDATPHSAVDLLPSFVAAVAPGGPAAGWRGACFAENQAVLNLTQAAAGGCNATAAGLLGGAVLSIKVRPASP